MQSLSNVLSVDLTTEAQSQGGTCFLGSSPCLCASVVDRCGGHSLCSDQVARARPASPIMKARYLADTQCSGKAMRFGFQTDAAA